MGLLPTSRAVPEGTLRCPSQTPMYSCPRHTRLQQLGNLRQPFPLAGRAPLKALRQTTCLLGARSSPLHASPAAITRPAVSRPGSAAASSCQQPARPHLPFSPCRPAPTSQQPLSVPAAAASSAASYPEPHSRSHHTHGHHHNQEGMFDGLWAAAQAQGHKFYGLAGKFMPMVGLFFLLAFVNTILDSLKDTLVITAAGGGAQVIPYLTVYAVLPSSLVFLVLYSYASQRFSRAALFNGIVGVFISFFVAFGVFMYPNHQALHFSGMADRIGNSLPLGLEGAVGMVRNWTFTLFFCMSELWGDVCLGLLFWGLANDTTSLADAPTLYPLFGIGANVAQALAGFSLKFFSGPAAHGGSFTNEIQALMTVVVGFAAVSLVVHQRLSAEDDAQRDARRKRRREEREARRYVANHALSDASAGSFDGGDSSEQRTADNQLQPGSEASSSGSVNGAAPAKKKRRERQKVSEIFKVLASSVPIRCLAVMSMAQGLCTSLMEFAWKSHIKMLYPTPAEFTSFLGDVSTWQGIVTGLLMVLSPTMFDRMGWSGVASATPQILLYGGGAFFVVSMAYQFIFAASAAAAASAAGLGLLNVLVFGGALLYVFSKSAKFSLFKPAEEMVYISLDEEGRTKGKAAIDVVGSQFGKSAGSMLQQALLLICGGAIAGQLPVMFAVFMAMSQGWLGSVATLSTTNNYGHQSSVHTSMDSMDEVVLPELVEAQLKLAAANLQAGKEAVPVAASGNGVEVLQPLPTTVVASVNGGGNGNGSGNGSGAAYRNGNGNGNGHASGNGVNGAAQPSAEQQTVYERAG